MVQQMGDGSLNVGTWALHTSDWQHTIPVDPSLVKKGIREQYADWDPRLLAFTQLAEDASITSQDLYMLPIGHSWAHKRGLSLIGDSAHLMTPFAGEGANLAMKDALVLSVHILAAAESTSPHARLDSKVAAFEQDMFARATRTQQMTYDMMSAMYFQDGNPRNGIEKYILTAISDGISWWTMLFMTPAVHAWFALFKLIY